MEPGTEMQSVGQNMTVVESGVEHGFESEVAPGVESDVAPGVKRVDSTLVELNVPMHCLKPWFTDIDLSNSRMFLKGERRCGLCPLKEITDLANADDHYTVFLTERDYFEEGLRIRSNSAKFSPHDRVIFSSNQFLKTVIDIISETNPIYAPLVGLKRYIKGGCGLCFVSGQSLRQNLALRYLLAHFTVVKAVYFFGIVAVRTPAFKNALEFVRKSEAPECFKWDRTLELYRCHPRSVFSDIKDSLRECVQDLPYTVVLLIDPKGVQKEEFDIVKRVLADHGSLLLASQKVIRRLIRERAQSPSYPYIQDLCRYVHGECGLIHVQGCNSVLTFLLQNTVVRALYLLGFVFPRSSLYLTWSKIEKEFPIPYFEIPRISIDGLLAHILRVSNNARGLLDLHGILKLEHDLLQVESTRLLPLLDQLDPAVNSLGYLYILEACNADATSMEQSSAVVSLTIRFINMCDKEQIQMAPEKFIRVCKRFRDLLIQLEYPLRGVAPMLTAIRKIQRSSEHLTVLHSEFLVLCLLSKRYKAGLSILDEDTFEVDQPKDLHLYCYYGGIIYIGQKSFGKALDLMHLALKVLAPAMNAILVEVYKKYILVSLIHSGQLSSSLSTVAERMLNSYCLPYIELANSWSTGNVADVEAVAQKHRESFDNDNNLRLVKQAISSMYKHKIRKVAGIYMTISLQDLAELVQLNSAKEAEMHLLQMIQDREISGLINQKDGVVSFPEEQFKIEDISSSIQRAIVLLRKLSTMNEDNPIPVAMGEEDIFTAEGLGRSWRIM